MSEETSPKLGWKAAMRNVFYRAKDLYLRNEASGNIFVGAGLMNMAFGAAHQDKLLLYGGAYMAFYGFRAARNYLMERIDRGNAGHQIHLHVHPRPHPV